MVYLCHNHKEMCTYFGRGSSLYKVHVRNWPIFAPEWFYVATAKHDASSINHYIVIWLNVILYLKPAYRIAK